MAVEAAGPPARTWSFRRGSATAKRAREWPVYAFLFTCASISIVTTFGIVFVLLEETVNFFEEVPLADFLSGTEWTPLFTDKHFGVLPLLNATLVMSALAMCVALPLGLLSAIYLGEYAPDSVRSIVKPVLEVLAGIPTVVYGYFAIQFIAPEIIRTLFGSGTSLFSALSASLAMGIMILPMVASLSEDAIRAVPRALREGAYGVGANKFEVSTRVVVPAALSGIVAAAILAISRAVGETMIVTLAGGNQPNLSWNPLEGMQAMTAYMVQVSQGDTPRGTLEYSTVFAIGTMLFVTTLVLNVIAQWLVTRFREVYE